jgi:hypothetical protein
MLPTHDADVVRRAEEGTFLCHRHIDVPDQVSQTIPYRPFPFVVVAVGTVLTVRVLSAGRTSN